MRRKCPILKENLAEEFCTHYCGAIILLTSFKFRPTEFSFRPTEIIFRPTEIIFRPTEIIFRPTEFSLLSEYWRITQGYCQIRQGYRAIRHGYFSIGSGCREEPERTKFLRHIFADNQMVIEDSHRQKKRDSPESGESLFIENQ